MPMIVHLAGHGINVWFLNRMRMLQGVNNDYTAIFGNHKLLHLPKNAKYLR